VLIIQSLSRKYKKKENCKEQEKIRVAGCTSAELHRKIPNIDVLFL